MNIVKAQAAVEYQARRLAQAMDAADNLAAKAQQAQLVAVQTAQAADDACAAVDTARLELEAAEAALATAQTEIAQSNGQATGTAFNATIRIEPND